MPEFSDIADDLPAPRDDEPSSLRQDIADELANRWHIRIPSKLAELLK